MTPKGERLAAEASSLFASADGMSKEEYLARVEKRFDAQQLRETGSGVRQPGLETAVRALSRLRACAFVCPTCACFDIQEDARGATGRRVRCWDSCGFSLFTLHTSGHNPRPVQSARWRQRVLHKFSYMPERIGQTGCTGCGRCSRACPVNMNLLEHLQSI
ncbi:MAG: 4Fe-4S dicluster domain-containing protein [Alistipes sp.]